MRIKSISYISCNSLLFSSIFVLNVKDFYSFQIESLQAFVSPSNQTVREGKPANISCKATSCLKPTLSWTFSEDGNLPQGEVVEDNEGRSFLKLKNASKLMAGTYKCTAKNKFHSTTASATLRVLGMPWFYADYIDLYIYIFFIFYGKCTYPLNQHSTELLS